MNIFTLDDDQTDYLRVIGKTAVDKKVSAGALKLYGLMARNRNMGDKAPLINWYIRTMDSTNADVRKYKLELIELGLMARHRKGPCQWEYFLGNLTMSAALIMKMRASFSGKNEVKKNQVILEKK